LCFPEFFLIFGKKGRSRNPNMQFTGKPRRVCAVILLSMVVWFGAASGQELNLWTNTASEKWEEPNWSLGILPGDSQIVQIAGLIPVTVEIDAMTVANYEASLSMAHLVVSNANTLLLNHTGKERPLHISAGTNIWYGLDVSGGSTLVNLDSAVVSDSFLGASRNGQILQGGGFMRALKGTYVVSGGKYNLTNGMLETGSLTMPSSGTFNQFGGTVKAGSVQLTFMSGYYLKDGELLLTNGLTVGDTGAFRQRRRDESNLGPAGELSFRE
jgi:hypothetical protein